MEHGFEINAADRAQWARYEPRLRRVITHIHDHLDEPLDLDALADVACLSPHHWHRIYRAMTGETLAQTVKRLRLHRAAGQLATTDRDVAQVAAAAGYPNVQSFTRTFGDAYGLPPARFRAEGQHRAFEMRSDGNERPDLDVTVQEPEALPVLALEHRGDYMDIGRTFDLLFSRIAAAGLARPGLRMFALYHDDPERVEPAALRAHAALAGCGSEPPAGTGVVALALPGGPHATLLHRGPYASMRASYQWLFGRWLPRSGLEPAAGPVIEEYIDSPRDTAPQDLRTRVHLPLRSAQPAAGPA